MMAMLRMLPADAIDAGPLPGIPPTPWTLGYVDGYVKHGRQRHGLGNVLFMINAALACDAEAY